MSYGKLHAMKALISLSLMSCMMLVGCDDASSPEEDGIRFVVIEAGNERCVSDEATGLLWQTKTEQPGLHNVANTYSWFHPGEENGELDYRGVEDGGSCDGSLCDTWNYIQAVNDAGLCGFNDWRIPEKNELNSISDIRRSHSPPTIDTAFFPLTRADEYWTGNDYSFQHESAWAWNFKLGHDRVDWKKTPKFIRLVRGIPGKLPQVKE